MRGTTKALAMMAGLLKLFESETVVRAIEELQREYPDRGLRHSIREQTPVSTAIASDGGGICSIASNSGFRRTGGAFQYSKISWFPSASTRAPSGKASTACSTATSCPVSCQG